MLEILDSGTNHVLGPLLSPWRKLPDALQVVSGQVRPREIADAWEWLRHAIPSRQERDPVFGALRQDLGLADGTFTTMSSWTALAVDARDEIEDRLKHERDGLAFLQANNPVVRHTILRRRKDLEQAGLLRPVAVDLYPNEVDRDARARAFFSDGGGGIATSPQLEEALAAAGRFCKALGARKRNPGFIESLLHQRICSSAASGLATCRVLLGGVGPDSTTLSRAPEAVGFERLRADNSMREDDNEELFPEQLAALASDMEEERGAQGLPIHAAGRRGLRP